jgi:hypothetical protein
MEPILYHQKNMNSGQDHNYLNKTNLQILLNQNDIVPILKKINKQSKITGRQMTLSEIISDSKVK